MFACVNKAEVGFGERCADGEEGFEGLDGKILWNGQGDG